MKRTAAAFAALEKKSKLFHIITSTIIACTLGCLDYITGYEFSIYLFYVLPIFLATWFVNQYFGYGFSVASAVMGLVVDITTHRPYSDILFPIWDTLIRLAFFVIITHLLSSLKYLSHRERELSRTDHLTGAANSRHFYEAAQKETHRLRRHQHPFTVAYIDVDNFKHINDQFGHAKGDLVLKAVVDSIKKNIRAIDMVARLGGDEFALLLPETSEESARSTLKKVHGTLLEEMRRHQHPVTFSIGAVTYKTAPKSVDELVKIADELMYSAKLGGKNAIKFSTFA
jgi:diguanylate cyclase (GGDEF)-like protein